MLLSKLQSHLWFKIILFDYFLIFVVVMVVNKELPNNTRTIRKMFILGVVLKHSVGHNKAKMVKYPIF